MSLDVSELGPESWVALIAAGVALLVGLLSPIVGSWSAQRVLDGQRRMATDARVWAKRAETYEAVLGWAGGVRTRLSVLVRDGSAQKSEELDKFLDEFYLPQNIQVGLAAYASDAVNRAVQVFIGSVEELAVAAKDAVSDPGDASELNAALLSLDHNRVVDRLAQLISDDLHDVLEPDYGRPPGGPRRRFPEGRSH